MSNHEFNRLTFIFNKGDFIQGAKKDAIRSDRFKLQYSNDKSQTQVQHRKDGQTQR